MQIAEGLCDHPGWNNYAELLNYEINFSDPAEFLNKLRPISGIVKIAKYKKLSPITLEIRDVDAEGSLITSFGTALHQSNNTIVHDSAFKKNQQLVRPSCLPRLSFKEVDNQDGTLSIVSDKGFVSAQKDGTLSFASKRGKTERFFVS